jgi:hypothetical protein
MIHIENPKLTSPITQVITLILYRYDYQVHLNEKRIADTL